MLSESAWLSSVRPAKQGHGWPTFNGPIWPTVRLGPATAVVAAQARARPTAIGFSRSSRLLAGQFGLHAARSSSRMACGSIFRTIARRA